MAREKITSGSQDLLTARSVIIPVAKGEQLHYNVTLHWLITMVGFTKLCKVVEGLNDGAGTRPTDIQPSGVVTTISIIDDDLADNTFKLVIPANLISGWARQPTPEASVFGFIDLEVADPGVGSAQQIWKPLQGMIEVSYSPTEAT